MIGIHEGFHTCAPIIVREPQLETTEFGSEERFCPKIERSKIRYSRPVKNINREPQELHEKGQVSICLNRGAL